MEGTDNELRQEKIELRKRWSNSFLLELDCLVEKCFLTPKAKKEHFITKEKIEIELLKLLQTQKKFQSPTSSRTDLRLLAVFHVTENKIGKIKSIYVDRQEVEFIDMFHNTQIQSFFDIIIFDVYSPELEIYFEKQKRFYDAFSYKDVFAFLTYSWKKEMKKEFVKRITTVSGVQQIKLDHVDYSK